MNVEEQAIRKFATRANLPAHPEIHAFWAEYGNGLLLGLLIVGLLIGIFIYQSQLNADLRKAHTYQGSALVLDITQYGTKIGLRRAVTFRIQGQIVRKELLAEDPAKLEMIHPNDTVPVTYRKDKNGIIHIDSFDAPSTEMPQ